MVANDGLVSLREAITATNTNAAFSDTAAGDATGDRIRFASSLAGQTIQLTAGEFEITDDVVIVGDVTLDAQNQSRILNIDTSENVVLSQLTFINGNVGDEFGARDGGAIYISEGNLLISAAEFRSNSAANSGGAIFSFDSELRIARSTFIDNVADTGGAISGVADNFDGSIEGSIVVFQSTFTNNQATVSQGGAINVVAEFGVSRLSVVVSQSTFTNNRASGAGGAINVVEGEGDPTSVRVIESTFVNNTAGFGGAINVVDEVGSSTSLSVIESTFDNNTAEDNTFRGGSGGAIRVFADLFVRDSTFTGNASSGSGGAIFASSVFDFVLGTRTLPDATVLNSEFIDNSAGFSGGGIFSTSDVTTYVTNSLFENNEAGSSPDAGSFEGGGGIGAEDNLFVTDSTFESNTATLSGGAIHISDFSSNAVLNLNRVSILNNRAGQFGGGIFANRATVSLIDSIVSSNRVNNPNVPAGTLTTNPLLGGGLYTSGFDDLTYIRNTDFSNNFAGHGGGAVYASSIPVTVVDSNFTDNRVLSTLAPELDPDETFSGGGGAILHSVGNGGNATSQLTIRDTVFRDNVALFGGPALDFGSRLTFLGGAVAAINSDADIRDSSFFGNLSEGSGGALAQTGPALLRLAGNDFVGNRAGSNRLATGAGFESIGTDDAPNGLGGAVFLDNSSRGTLPIRIFGGEFRGNTAVNSGGAIFATSSTPTDLLIRARAEEGTRFINNRALRWNGGAIAGDGVGLNARDAFFSTNTARDGGAIFVRGGDELRIVFSEFRRNAARARGGAVNYSDIEFIDFQNVFANNTAVLGPDFFEQP